MLNLSKQERLRHRYQTEIVPGHKMGLDVYREMLARTITPQSRVLDVGCGPAGLVAEYEGYASSVVGIDEYLTNFTEFDGDFGITQLAESRIDALPFPDDTFDVVTCSWVLEHIADPDISMKEVARVLVPGGRFIFITPNALNYVVGLRRLVPDFSSRQLVKMVYDRDEDFINPTFYQMNTPNDVERICAGAGLFAERLQTVSDPTYLAVNELAFQLSVLIERWIDNVYPQARVHLVGVYRKRV
jgi:SAM-dependent methyltransferase